MVKLTWLQLYIDEMNNNNLKETEMKVDKIGYYKTRKGQTAYVVGFTPDDFPSEYDDDTVIGFVEGDSCRSYQRDGTYCDHNTREHDLVSYIGTTLKHIITIDGKDIELSHDSFTSLKEQLT